MGRWVLAAPCPPHPAPKVGMHKPSMGSPTPLLACSRSPWGTEGSRDTSTQHWLLTGGFQEVGVLQAPP